MNSEKRNMEKRRSVLAEIGYAIFGGLSIGFFNIWLEAYPYISFLASWAAGTLFSLIFILAYRYFGPLRGKSLLLITSFAGAIAGLTLWFFSHTKWNPSIFVGLGAIYGALLYFFEMRIGNKANDAA